MSSVSFYRKYRPQLFSDVRGQNHVKETLKNAIIFDRVSHAYLFTGPRGIGKTTIARIFSKVINCKSPKNGEPDNICESCKEISDDKSMDLIEIDGASNRGIDEIRELREKIKFTPHNNKYKIFIIDEVHMLTKEAFNALLKTLEEPPAHAIFILATTEIHKIPATVLSRCQRFNFSKLSIKEIIEELKRVSEKEKIKVDDESLYMIASYAEGAMRDATSMLDQISSFANKKITPEVVKEMLGLSGIETINTLIKEIANKNIKESLSILNTAVDNGIDINIFIDSIVDRLRNILFIKTGNKDQVRFLNERDEQKLTEISEQLSELEIVEIADEITSAKQKVKLMNPPQLALELSISKLVNKDKKPGHYVLEKLPQNKQGAENISQIVKEIPSQKIVLEKTSPKNPEPKNEKTDKQFDIEKINPSTISTIASNWPKIVEALKVHNHSIALCLKTAQPDKISDGILYISFQFPLHKDKIQELDNKRLVEDEISKHAGTLIPIRCYIGEKPTKSDNKTESPVIDSAMDIFEGEIIE